MSIDAGPASFSALQVHPYHLEDATVLECTGPLTFEHTDLLKAQVRNLVPTARRIIVDLKGVARMDSAGLGTLVALYISARKGGCEFLLVNYNSSIRNLLGLSNLLSIFESCAQSGMRIP
jgi:anti-sigma B factor antagonist